MPIPISYSYRNLLARRLTTFLTAAGMALHYFPKLGGEFFRMRLGARDLNGRAPHFCELALNELADTAAPPVVRTTLDSALHALEADGVIRRRRGSGHGPRVRHRPRRRGR